MKSVERNMFLQGWHIESVAKRTGATSKVGSQTWKCVRVAQMVLVWEA